METWVIQVKTARGWYSDFIDGDTRADVLAVARDSWLGALIADSAAPVLIRPAAYKEWIRAPRCGCPRCKNSVARV